MFNIHLIYLYSLRERIQKCEQTCMNGTVKTPGTFVKFGTNRMSLSSNNNRIVCSFAVVSQLVSFSCSATCSCSVPSSCSVTCSKNVILFMLYLWQSTLGLFLLQSIKESRCNERKEEKRENANYLR